MPNYFSAAHWLKQAEMWREFWLWQIWHLGEKKLNR